MHLMSANFIYQIVHNKGLESLDWKHQSLFEYLLFQIRCLNTGRVGVRVVRVVGVVKVVRVVRLVRAISLVRLGYLVRLLS